MVYNKDLTSHPGRCEQTIVLNGTKYNPMRFNKSTGIWEKLADAPTKDIAANTTSFNIGITQADMQFYRLNTDITPVINLLLND
jgi:hypothetical protein